MTLTYLHKIAQAVTPEFVSGLDDEELKSAASDAPGSGIIVELHGANIRRIPDHEFTPGESAVLWIGDDGQLIAWSGNETRPSGEVISDGSWVYDSRILIDPEVLAERTADED